jgi:hypothetical protein
MSFSEIATLILTVVGFIWLGAFKFAGLEHNVQEIDKSLYRIHMQLNRIDARLNRLESEFHKMDVRVNLLEQHKR